MATICIRSRGSRLQRLLQGCASAAPTPSARHGITARQLQADGDARASSLAYQRPGAVDAGRGFETSAIARRTSSSGRLMDHDRTTPPSPGHHQRAVKSKELTHPALSASGV